MTKYEPRISQERDGEFYALIVSIDDYDGQEYVIHTYKGRHFKTKRAALRSTDKHIALINKIAVTPQTAK